MTIIVTRHNDKKTWYFGFRIQNVSTGAEHRGKLQARAHMQGTAITDALEQVRQCFNGGSIRIDHGDLVRCQMTNLETEESGWFECYLSEHWAAQRV